MGLERSKILRSLENFKNPTYMRNRYGITITKDQILETDRIIDHYKKIDEEEIIKEDFLTQNQIPYRLNTSQEYDMMLYSDGIHLNITQTLLWQNIKQKLSQESSITKDDTKAIACALREIEEFLQLNMYIGKFDENKNFIDNKKPDDLMRLFNNAYKKYSN